MKYVRYVILSAFVILLVNGLLLAKPPVFAVENVNVIPMTHDRVVTSQTIIIENGVITKIGNHREVKIPRKATRIQGEGKYIMPGLMDMHVHLFTDTDFPVEHAKEELKVILANGVTTARIMSGNANHLQMRKQVAENTLTGPNLFVASPEIAGRKYYKGFRGIVVQTPTEAVDAIKKSKSEGYDFVKLTYAISVPVYESITQTAKELNIPIIGHIGPEVKLERAIQAGQQIEHLDEYMEALLKPDAPNNKISVSGSNIWKLNAWETMDYIDENKIAEVVKATKDANIYNTPTSAFLHMAFGSSMSDEEINKRPDLKFIPAYEKEYMKEGRSHYLKNMPSEERRIKFMEVRNKIVKAMHEAGCKLMAGSDTPSWLLTYGFTLHRELEHFVMAGLSPYAALQTATVTPAEYLGVSDKLGTIEEGKQADLVLLEANPLENINHTQVISGVMHGKNWYDKKALQKLLDEASQVFQK